MIQRYAPLAGPERERNFLRERVAGKGRLANVDQSRANMLNNYAGTLTARAEADRDRGLGLRSQGLGALNNGIQSLIQQRQFDRQQDRIDDQQNSWFGAAGTAAGAAIGSFGGPIGASVGAGIGGSLGGAIGGGGDGGGAGVSEVLQNYQEYQNSLNGAWSAGGGGDLFNPPVTWNQPAPYGYREY